MQKNNGHDVLLIKRLVKTARANLWWRKPVQKRNVSYVGEPSVVARLLAVGLTLTLSACATTPLGSPQVAQAMLESNQADSVVEPNIDQIKIVTAAELAEDESLPKQDLTAETLEQLLTLNFASYGGQWPLAAENSLSAAEQTKDFRLARLATLFALQTSDYGQASVASELWLSLKPKSVDAQNMNIIALVGASKVEPAKAAVERQMQGQSIDDYIKQAAALLVRQKNEEAGFEVIDYLVEMHPESAQVHVSAAYVAEVFEKYEAAEFWVNKALELRPGWDLAAQMNVRLLKNQNKAEERSLFIEEFVSQYPSSIAMRIGYSADLAAQKEFQAAYEIMLAVLKDAPDNVGALQYSAALAQQLDDPKKAAYYYRRALNIAPKDDEIRWSAARLAQSEQKYITAGRFYRDISAPEKLFEAQIQVANIQYEIEGIESAIRVLAVTEPSTNDEYLQLAITRHYLLMRSFKYEEAFGYTNDALVFMPDNPDLLYARALVAAELKKIIIAEQDLRMVIAIDPKNANALNALGYTLADQTDRLDEAKALIAQALVLRPNDAHILDSWGWVSYRLKDYVTAIEYLKRAYEASPEAEVAAHLGEALWESGDQDAAIGVWQTAYDKDSDNPVLTTTLQKYEVNFKNATKNRDVIKGVKSVAVEP
jgi:tetratricopeptide (TPR) repeat protein